MTVRLTTLRALLVMLPLLSLPARAGEDESTGEKAGVEAKGEKKKKKKPGNLGPMAEADVGRVLREAGPQQRG